MDVRRAAPTDADELARLRVLMFRDMGEDISAVDAEWLAHAAAHFRMRLSSIDEFAAFVVDKPEGGLAACAVGWLNPHLIGLVNQSGRTGYVANMSTDPEFRRRGYGRVTLTALLDWMRSTGIGVVHLHASRDGDALYRSMGFQEPHQTAMTLRLIS